MELRLKKPWADWPKCSEDGCITLLGPLSGKLFCRRHEPLDYASARKWDNSDFSAAVWMKNKGLEHRDPQQGRSYDASQIAGRDDV